MVKIYNSGNVLETNQIIQTLQSHGIPAMKKDVGAGGYMNIATGMSFQGADIYVAEEHSEQAKEIVQMIAGEVEKTPDKSGSVWTRRVVAIALFVVLLIGLVGTVLAEL